MSSGFDDFPEYDGKDGDVEYGIEYIKLKFLAFNHENGNIPIHVTCNGDEDDVRAVF